VNSGRSEALQRGARVDHRSGVEAGPQRGWEESETQLLGTAVL